MTRTSVVISAVLVSAVPHGARAGWPVTVDPRDEASGEASLMTGVPESFLGMHVNDFLGADRFYRAGVTGQGTAVAVVDPGRMWNGHVTLAHVNDFITGTGALGEVDRHATSLGMIIGGRKYAVNPQDWQTGIATGTRLRSAAVATSWKPSSTGLPRYSLSFTYSSASMFGAARVAFDGSEAVNVSWGSVDPAGTSLWTLGFDGLARANPGATLVAAAGNNGPAANTVVGVGSGYNSIAVAALMNPNAYDVVSDTGSRGPLDYGDPVNGLVAGARVGVDIAAPGRSITSAYYGGETGGNGPSLGGSPGGVAGSPTHYSNFSGSSYATAVVSGAVALVGGASYNTAALAGNGGSRDARVVKSVLLNSAWKTPGWDNGQAAVGGVITTERALDYAVGAGRLDVGAAYEQYLAGTTDVPGTGGGTVGAIGWDYGAVGPAGVNDYVIDGELGAGTPLNVTLSWFRERTLVDDNTATDDAYRDLDLEVWDGTFTTLVARSVSRYENVEHLSFAVPATGRYGIRVRYFGTVFGAPAEEAYGLAWANELLVPGDANGDRRVDVDDFALIDRGYARALTGWSNGDFDGSGVVGAADYLIIDGALGRQAGALPAWLLAAREAEFGAEYVAELVAAVPEPVGVGAVMVALAVGGRRRR